MKDENSNKNNKSLTILLFREDIFLYKSIEHVLHCLVWLIH